MKKSRYLLKRTKFALFTGVLPLLLGIFLIALSIFLICFNVWASSLTINKSLLPMANNPPIFYDIDGNELDYKSDNYLKPEEISNNLKFAFVALEDKRFYEHNGFDTYRIVGAMAKNISSGGVVEGASTITQQLIKNTHLNFEKTITRKFKEIALATKLEQIYTKDEILSMYLSVIYFGNGAYGVKSASKLYFGKDVKDLTLAECATLAGIIKNPSKYSPNKNPLNATTRRNTVLSVMEKQGYIDHSQMLKSSSEDMITVENDNSSMSNFFLNMASQEVCEKLNITKYQLDNSGLKIFTTYSPKVQKILYENGNLTDNFSKNDVANSSVIIDNETGYVLGYTSSLGYEVSRQCGSKLKPIVVYAPALEENIITLATPISDEQVKYGNWTPKNYGDKYVGTTNIREAIKHSSNTVAVKVGSYVGENKMYEYGKRFGIDLNANDTNLTLALGATTKGQSPLQIASAYSIFANSGQKQNATFLRMIVKDGKKIYKSNNQKQQIVSNETAFMITDCLVDTVKSGTAKTLNSLPFALASKTGTVSNSKGENTDGWNVSFNNKYTIAVWHGDSNETGGGHPTKHAYNIWMAMGKISKIADFESGFSTPKSIIVMPVDTYSTKKLGHVAIATDHTPQKHIKNEYFRRSNKVYFENSLFEECAINFNIMAQNQDEHVTISFVADEIYTYYLERLDLLGNTTIAIINGDNKNHNICDTPFSFGLPIKYKLIACIKGQTPSSHIVGTAEKTIMI